MRTRAYALLCLAAAIFGGTSAHALELVGQPQVLAAVGGATVRWQTDVACGTRLQYGLSASELNQKAEAGVTSQHEIVLQGLAPGTTYHYSVGSARARLATGSFTTPGLVPAASAQPSLIRRAVEAVVPGKKPAPAAFAAKPAPPARQTWGNIVTLQDHFERHGRDFGSKSADDYAARAWQFLQTARSQSLPMKLDDTDKTLRIFDPKTRAFAAYNGDGKTKTYFKPDSADYWQRQPGRPVRSSDLPFPLFSP